MIWLTIIWFVFATIFLALGCLHWKMAGRSIAYLQVKQLMPEGMKAKVVLLGVDFQEFTDKFNDYITYYNQTSSKQHKFQAVGYWVASATAIFSFIVTILQ